MMIALPRSLAPAHHDYVLPTFAIGIVAALILAVSAPVLVTVLGLIIFGLLHNYFELRYVIGRYCWGWSRPFAVIIGALLTAILARRLFLPNAVGEPIEIVASYAALAAALVLRRAGHDWIVIAGFTVLAGLLACSLTYSSVHFVIISHLHNVLPLVFLWQWSGGLNDDRWRWQFRGMHMLWVLVIPLALLAGAGEIVSMPTASAGFGIAGDALIVARAYTPPALFDGVLPLRFLMVFAFLQSMHYLVWCWFFRRVGLEERARVSDWLDARALPSGGLLLAGVIAMGVILGIFIWTDYTSGKSLYAALATYHAYLELPVIVGMLILPSRRDSIHFSAAASGNARIGRVQ